MEIAPVLLLKDSFLCTGRLPRQSADWLAMTRNFGSPYSDSNSTLNYNLSSEQAGENPPFYLAMRLKTCIIILYRKEAGGSYYVLKRNPQALACHRQ